MTHLLPWVIAKWVAQTKDAKETFLERISSDQSVQIFSRNHTIFLSWSSLSFDRKRNLHQSDPAQSECTLGLGSSLQVTWTDL